MPWFGEGMSIIKHPPARKKSLAVCFLGGADAPGHDPSFTSLFPKNKWEILAERSIRNTGTSYSTLVLLYYNIQTVRTKLNEYVY